MQGAEKGMAHRKRDGRDANMIRMSRGPAGSAGCSSSMEVAKMRSTFFQRHLLPCNLLQASR